MNLTKLTYDQLHELFWRVEDKARATSFFTRTGERISNIRDKVRAEQHNRLVETHRRNGWI